MIIYLFMYIFSFPVLKNIPYANSNFLVGAVLMAYFLFKPKFRSYTLTVLKKKYTIFIFSFLLILILYSLFITTMLGAYDFSLVKSFINQGINLIIAILVFSLYKTNGKTEQLPIHLIYIFIIQALIQILSFALPEINDVLNLFRTDSAIIRGQINTWGLRGLAISGYAFFGLGIGYGLIFIYYFENWNQLFPKIPILKYLFLGLLTFGAISAARTSLIGLGIGVFYHFINVTIISSKQKKINPQKIVSKLIKSILLLVSASLFLSVFIPLVLSQNKRFLNQIEDFFNFAFEFVNNIQKNGQLTTNSTNTLFNNMYFQVGTKTVLLGDGFYESSSGYYYMGTDAGYMRNILFFGVFGIAILIIYQLMFFMWENKKEIFLNICLILFIFIAHVKGETIGFLVIMQAILFLMFLCKKDKYWKEV